MKKVLFVFCGALFAICLLNVNLASKGNAAKKINLISLNKALAGGEDDPAPYPSDDPNDYVDNPDTGNSSLDDPIVGDPVSAQPGPPARVPLN